MDHGTESASAMSSTLSPDHDDMTTTARPASPTLPPNGTSVTAGPRSTHVIRRALGQTLQRRHVCFSPSTLQGTVQSDLTAASGAWELGDVSDGASDGVGVGVEDVLAVAEVADDQGELGSSGGSAALIFGTHNFLSEINFYFYFNHF